MDKPEQPDGDPKAKADRAKFESIKKITTEPVITRGSRGRKVLVAPDLKSPDEMNPKWITDPEEIMAAKKAKAKEEKRDLKATPEGE